MGVQLLTLAAYSRHRGCDEKAVRKAIAENRITAIERDGRKWIDPEVADIQWARNTRPRMNPGVPASAAASSGSSGGSSGQPGSPSAQSQLDLISANPSSPGNATSASTPPPQAPAEEGYSTHKAREARAAADMAEMKAATMARTLLKRDDAMRGTFEAFRVLRDHCFNSAKTVSRQVIGLTELREIEILLEDGYRQAFAAAEQDLTRMFQEPVA